VVSESSVAKDLFVLFLDQLGDLEFTGNFSLAKATSRDLHSIFSLLGRTDNGIAILEAFIFVVAFGRNGPRRAPSRTGLAGFIIKVETIGLMVGVFVSGWLKNQIRYNAADAYGFSPGRDKPVTQSESPQTAGVGRMALGPGGGYSYPGRLEASPVRGVHGSDSFEPFLLK